MNLRYVIDRLEDLSPDGIIFAQRLGGRFLPESQVAVVELSDEELSQPLDRIASLKAPGLEYFLEVDIIQDFLEGWEQTGGVERTQEEKLAAVIHYAENDA